MELLAVIAGLLVIVTPILAISAFVRVQHLTDQLRTFPLKDLVARLYALEQRLAALEKVLASPGSVAAAPRPAPEAPPVSPPLPGASAPLPIPAAPSKTTPVAPPLKPRELPSPPAQINVFAAPPLHSSQYKTTSALDLETLIGGRWMNRIGIVAIIGAVAFFLKYAFDNNWIGPSGRVAIGILLGASMLPWSHWLLRRGYSYFSEGIAGLGAAVLYLSIWAGCQYYTLFTRDVGFYAMIVITAVMAAVALGRNSQRIALLSVFGGFLTPLLVSTGKDAQVVLFTYLLILGAGLLVIDARRNWRALSPISFLLTQFYFWGWYSEFYRQPKLERTLVFATLFFLLYAALPVIRAAKYARLHEVDLLVALANSFAYLGALYLLLWPKDRWPLTLLALALSAVHVMVARLIPPPKSGESPVTRFLFAGLALTFATLAIPIRLDGKWITLAFAVEGAILVWTGLRSATALMRVAGYFLLAISAFRLLFFPLPAPRFLFNERFITYGVLIACFAAVLYAAGEYASTINKDELILFAGIAVAINDSALLRWQALVLFGLVVVKVFIYDSSYLERFYRIVSFFILGLVLLVVSFLYQRKVARERSPS